MIYDIHGNTLSAEDGVLNMLACGLKNDGTTDNLALFNTLKEKYPGKTFYFPPGVYAFAGKLCIDRCYFWLDNAELKCTASNKVNRFLELRGQMYPRETPQWDQFIRGNGILNGNFKTDDCIALARQKHTLIEGITIKNFQRYGICGKFEDSAFNNNNLSYELDVKDCLIENDLTYTDAVGIYDTGDSTFSDIVILNVKTALSCSSSSVFHNIHAWCFDFDYSDNDTKTTLMKDTVFASLRGNGSRFSDCYCDTYQKGFQFAAGQYLAYLYDFKWFINTETWPTGLSAYVFPANPSGAAMYKVFGANINGQGVTKFSDVDLSTQTNCRWYGVVHNLSDAPSTLQ